MENKYKVLIAEDAPVQGKKLQYVLQKFGHEVTWCINGKLAYEALLKDDYSLVISDYQMPEWDGLKFLEEMKNNEKLKNIPFILLTTIEDENIFFTSLKLGANEFLNKPFRSEELKTRCTNLIMLYEYQKLIENENETLETELIEKNRILEEKLSELKVANVELKDMQSQLIQASKMASLGTMGAGVAHEINNPLTIINASNNRLKKIIDKGDHDELRLKKINNNIQKAVTRILNIVKHLKVFSSGNNNSNDAELVELNEVLKDLQDFYGGLTNKYEIKVNHEYSTDPLYIKGFRTALEQVFLNLVHNAIDAMDGCLKKSLTLRTYTDGNQAVVEVEDSGTGIPMEIQNKIFDPFFTTKEVGKGTGLGMALVVSYLKECRGNISLESVPGKTLFKITFIMAEREAA